MHAVNNDGNATYNGVVAVVVTHNRKEVLRECLQALTKQDEHALKIIVVDNASEDGTYEHIIDFIDGDKIVYRNTGKNLGGAGGFSFGIKEAAKTDCRYIWLMDDDCVVRRDSLSALLRYAAKINDRFGFLSSVALWTDGSVCEMNVQRTSISKSVRDFKKEDQKIILASFVSLFLNRDAVMKCGLPIKEFFIWGDDWEYTGRISKRFDNYLVPQSVVTHRSDKNAGVDITRESPDRLDRYFYAYRNEKYFYDRFGLKGKLYHFAKICYHKLKITFSNCNGKKKKLDIMRKGLKAAKGFDPTIEYI